MTGLDLQRRRLVPFRHAGRDYLLRYIGDISGRGVDHVVVIHDADDTGGRVAQARATELALITADAVAAKIDEAAARGETRRTEGP